VSELDHYHYELPRELIAQRPLSKRADARLMVVDRGTGSIEHFHVRDLPELLRPGDRLVLNDTRVVPAALAGQRAATGGRWQGLFLAEEEHGLWQVLGKTRGKLQVGEAITLVGNDGQRGAELRLVARQAEGIWLARPEPAEAALDVLARVGRVPLPHYIRDGEMNEEDVLEYQTVYATQPGAVAAPTAGLHFTPELLVKLEQSGVRSTRLTLHVGLGTFRPITAGTLAEHAMHSEWARLTPEAAEELNSTRAAGRRIVAVGTTSVRTLETAARSGRIEPFSGQTNLFIRPPYEFRAVDALLTNFHLPRTTLLVLVRTFGGDKLIARAYEEAIAESYRFYSYGDAMLIV
jgi:S-adenosylmethionine:tRNA ribosyltransferase-isomerase